MMRVLIGMACGMTATMLAYVIWQPAIDRRDVARASAWLFTRIPPATDPACKSRFRTWRNHIEVSREPW
jgi:hypothetical protein